MDFETRDKLEKQIEFSLLQEYPETEFSVIYKTLCHGNMVTIFSDNPQGYERNNQVEKIIEGIIHKIDPNLHFVLKLF